MDLLGLLRKRCGRVGEGFCRSRSAIDSSMSGTAEPIYLLVALSATLSVA